MKAWRWFVAVPVAVLAGWLIGSAGPPRAEARPQFQAVGGRYQISAWSTPASEQEPFRQVGCFMVDTMNGELWALSRQEPKTWERVAARPGR
jgi:hypothetical protein